MVLLVLRSLGMQVWGKKLRKYELLHKLEEALRDNLGGKSKTEIRKDMGGEMAHVAVNINPS